MPKRKEPEQRPEAQSLTAGGRTSRAAIVGTGYIADFHALGIRNAGGVELAAVCDSNIKNAEAFAATWQVPNVYESFDAMLKDQALDAVHILTPPDLHHPLGMTALAAGVNVLIEKPMCTSLQEADELCATARKRGLHLGVSHNMLFATPYQRLRDLVHSGALGPLDHIAINHFVELAPIRLGPFGSWMLRAPGNVLLEIGPHLISALLDLVGKPEQFSVSTNRRAEMPGGGHAFARWRIQTKVKSTAVDININLGPGFPQRTLHVRGLLGSATVDYDANTCTVERRTALGLDLDRYKRSRLAIDQIRSQAWSTLSDYVLSKLKLSRRGNPYQVTFIDSAASYYSAIRAKSPLDTRIDGASGRDVIDCCGRIIRAAGIGRTTHAKAAAKRKRGIRPTVLVFGGTGFIGRELIRQLLAANYSVRAAVRGSSAGREQFECDQLEIVRCDFDSAADIRAKMKGIDFVYHLALANVKSWEDNVRLNIDLTRRIADACLATGVKRLIYTGTIDSYYAGGRAGTIAEQTALDANPHRNTYARAKTAAENILTELHRTKQLPVVIFRPGIVIGQGGNAFHFGVGAWVSEGVVEVWGNGKNPLPFVLVADVAAALVRGIQVPGIEGRSFNLVDDPILTARDYLEELQRRANMAVDIHYRPIWRFYATDIAKWVLKVAVRHPDRARVPSYSDWESRTQKARFDNTRARTELGWAPASDRNRLLEEGVGGSLQAWLAARE